MTIETGRSGYSETWLDVVAAVDYIAATHRPGLTVWGALEEAVRWWMAARLDPLGEFPSPPTDLPWADLDPMRTCLQELLATLGPVGSMDGHPLEDALNAALGAWQLEMSRQFNDGQMFGRWRVR